MQLNLLSKLYILTVIAKSNFTTYIVYHISIGVCYMLLVAFESSKMQDESEAIELIISFIT